MKGICSSLPQGFKRDTSDFFDVALTSPHTKQVVHTVVYRCERQHANHVARYIRVWSGVTKPKPYCIVSLDPVPVS